MNSTNARSLATLTLSTLMLVTGCSSTMQAAQGPAAASEPEVGALSGTLRWNGFDSDQTVQMGAPSFWSDKDGTLMTAAARVGACSTSVALYLDIPAVVPGAYALGDHGWLVYEQQCEDEIVAWVAHSGQVRIDGSTLTVTHADLLPMEGRAAALGTLSLTADAALRPSAPTADVVVAACTACP